MTVGANWTPPDMTKHFIVVTTVEQCEYREGVLHMRGGEVFDPAFASVVANEDLVALWNMLQRPYMAPEPWDVSQERIYAQMKAVAEQMETVEWTPMVST